MSVYDLFLLSDRVELTDVVTRNGQPVFNSGRQSPVSGRSGLWDLDFAAVRVSKDVWHVVKARKPLCNDPQGNMFLGPHHAVIQPPVEFLSTF